MLTPFEPDRTWGSPDLGMTMQLQAARQQIQVDESIIANLTSGLNGVTYGLNTSFILFSAFSVFFMQIGFAIFVAGVVRAKNMGDVLLKSAIDTVISVSKGWGFLGKDV